MSRTSGTSWKSGKRSQTIRQPQRENLKAVEGNLARRANTALSRSGKNENEREQTPQPIKRQRKTLHTWTQITQLGNIPKFRL